MFSQASFSNVWFSRIKVYTKRLVGQTTPNGAVERKVVITLSGSVTPQGKICIRET